jgi:hypothetical protein
MLLFGNEPSHYQAFLTKCLNHLRHHYDLVTHNIIDDLCVFSSAIEYIHQFDSKFRLDILKFRLTRDILGQDPLGDTDSVEWLCTSKSKTSGTVYYEQLPGFLDNYLVHFIEFCGNVKIFKLKTLDLQYFKDEKAIQALRDCICGLPNLKEFHVSFRNSESVVVASEASFFQMPSSIAIHVHVDSVYKRGDLFKSLGGNRRVEGLSFPTSEFRCFILSPYECRDGFSVCKHLKV